MKRILTAIFSFLVLGTACFAGGPESTWAWGVNEVEAKGTWMNMEKLVQQKKYDEAAGKVVWLLKNTPDLNVALYINAIKVYERRAKEEKNPALRSALEDSTLMLYDKRVELFGDKANVLNRKGKVAFDYLGERSGTSEELYQLYKEIYQLNGNNTYPENATRYLQTACMLYANKKLTKQEVFEVYNNSNQVFAAQVGAETDSKKIDQVEKYKSYADQVFATNVEITCEDIQSQFGPQFSQKQDLNTAKIVVSLSVGSQCYDSEVFEKAGEYMMANNASNYSLQKIMATVYERKGELGKAKEAFTTGINFTEDSTKKAAFYLEIAQLEEKSGAKSSARTNALKALELDAQLLKAYNLIGDMYFQSANQCQSENKVQSRSVYIAAYNMYMKAGNSNGAAAAKAQFPSMEEMFLYNLKPGDSMNTGCWIGENVKLIQR